MEKINYNTLSKEEFLKEQQNRNEILKQISICMRNKKFNDKEVQEYIKQLYNWMNKFYDCSINMFKGLAEIYEFNSEFSTVLTQNYGENMSEFLSKSILFFCENNK